MHTENNHLFKSTYAVKETPTGALMQTKPWIAAAPNKGKEQTNSGTETAREGVAYYPRGTS